MTKYTETKKVINPVFDGVGPGGTCLSIQPLYNNNGWVRIVVGARFEDRFCNVFRKSGLGELIEILKDIHSAMED